MYLKAHFTYDPRKDNLIPCRDAGLPFKDGEILQVVNMDDNNWWQVRENNFLGFLVSLDTTLPKLHCMKCHTDCLPFRLTPPPETALPSHEVRRTDCMTGKI